VRGTEKKDMAMLLTGDRIDRSDDQVQKIGTVCANIKRTSRLLREVTRLPPVRMAGQRTAQASGVMVIGPLMGGT
jgi:hypothetical protein